jgi:AcrR family transcriptional regulator
MMGEVIEVKAALSARHEHILDAAQTCFVRNGFHPTTMQDIAREAAMSPGNIYRYFASKEAVVVELCAREARRGEALVARLEQSGDTRACLLGIIEQYFVGASREIAILRLELWSEVARNPTIAGLMRDGEKSLRDWFVEKLSELATSADCDLDALYMILSTLMNGVLVGRALSFDYDPKPAIAHLVAVMDAALCGAPLALASDEGPRR